MPTSMKLPTSLKDDVRAAIALLQVLGIPDAPKDLTGYMILAAREKIARDRQLFEQRFQAVPARAAGRG